MLIFDSESSFIPAEESEVEAVYRSCDPLFMGDDGSLPSCEAFVCIINREHRHQVFTAIHVMDIKRNLIYVVEPASESPSSTDPLTENALAFVGAMGFSMEAVNLKYGKAMREVVLRSIPVLLSIENLERTSKEKKAEFSELNRLIAEAADEADDPAEESDPEKQGEATRARDARKNAANAAARKLALEKCASEKAAAVEELVRKYLLDLNATEIAQLDRSERERLQGENGVLETRVEELAGILRQVEKQAETDRTKAQRRIAELEAEAGKNLKEAEAARTRQEESVRDQEAGEKRIAELELTLKKVREELEAERGRGKEWPGMKKNLEKQILELEKAFSKRSSKEEAEEVAAAALVQAEERIAGLQKELSESLETVEAERFERELLVREKAAALKRIEELGAAGSGEARVLHLSGGENDSAMEERLSGMKRAADQVKDQLEIERTERQRLEAELEKRIMETKEALEDTAETKEEDAHAGERAAELKQALQRAEERTEFLRLEVERLAAAKAAVEKQLAEMKPSLRKAAATPPAAAMSATKTGDPTPSPRIVRRPPPKGAFFQVDWELGGVEYESPDDILEVHQSMNLVQLSLEGYHGQHCSAWIVGLKKGKSRQVHVVFGLLESGLNLIYSPVKPIRNNDDYKKAAGEAVKFLEVVGYLPEKVLLGASPRERGDALKDIPVLQNPREKAQGF